jgi:hypothetical protein
MPDLVRFFWLLSTTESQVFVRSKLDVFQRKNRWWGERSCLERLQNNQRDSVYVCKAFDLETIRPKNATVKGGDLPMYKER